LRYHYRTIRRRHYRTIRRHHYRTIRRCQTIRWMN
jgi:hypothetical protein